MLIAATWPAGKLFKTHAFFAATVAIGFNVETVTYKNIKFQVWDLGGQTSIRPYWRCYYPNTQAIIYVVDSSDTERISTSAGEFHAILEEEELKDALILVYANKQVRLLAFATLNVVVSLVSPRSSRTPMCSPVAYSANLNPLQQASVTSQDLPGALSDAQVAEGLGLSDIKSRDWAIFKTSAIKGEGLFEGLDWLSNMLKTKRR